MNSDRLTLASRNRWAAPLTTLVLVALATAARWFGIGAESLWLDEATSLILARMSVPELVRWTALDIHPPLYYTLLHFWRYLGESEAAIRSLSALAGVLNVLVIAALGRTLFERRTGWIAGLLLALAPLHVWYSQEARMYAWIALLVTTSLWLAIEAWLEPTRWVLWVGYVLATTAALYTHYYAVFGILLANLFFLYLLIRRRLTKRLFWSWAAAQGAVFALFLPWLPTFLLPITVGGGGWVALGMGKPSVAVLAQTAVLYMVGMGRALYPALIRRAAYALFVGLFLVGLWPRKSVAQPGEESPRLFSERETVGFCLAYLVAPLGIAWVSSQLFKPMYSARYMLPFLMPFVLLTARGVGRIPWRVGRIATLAALVGTLVVGIVAQTKMMDKPDWRSWAQQIAARAEPGDVVVFVPGWHAKPFDYYARGAVELYGDVPVPVDQFGQQALDAVAMAIRNHPRVWFIWETDHYTDRDGQVYRYLAEHCRQIEEHDLPLVGRVILFDNSASKGQP